MLHHRVYCMHYLYLSVYFSCANIRCVGL